MKKALLVTFLITPAILAQAQDATDTTDHPVQIGELISFLCLFLVVVLFVLFQSAQQRNSRSHRKMREEIEALKLKGQSANWSTTPVKNERNELADLALRIDQLEQRQPISVPEKMIVEPKAEPEPEINAIPTVIAPEPEKEPIAEDVFYLSIPNKDGSFNVSSAQANYKPGASIYWFKKTAPDKAVFKIDGRDSTVKHALQYAEKSIDPACESMNDFNMAAAKITTRPGDEGEAELEGDKWKIKRKAKIYYE